MIWTEKGTVFHDAGDVGGDAQAGPSHNRRWWQTAAGGEFAVIDVYTYPAYVDWTEVDPDPSRLAIGVQISYTTCTDLDDIGGSETGSDLLHANTGVEMETAADADTTARALLTLVDPARLGWNDHQHDIDYQDVQAYCRAASGAQFLDCHAADGWRTKVDAVRLDMDDDCLCVLGQIGQRDSGSFETMVETLALTTEDCVRLGFFGDDGIHRPDDIDRLEAHWRHLITAPGN